MKSVRIYLGPLAALLVASSCKAPSGPEFGIPDDPDTGILERIRDSRDESWAEKRHRWKINEREKAKAMFDRMRDEY